MSSAVKYDREYNKKMLTLTSIQEPSESLFSSRRKDREVVTRRERFGADSRSSLVKYLDK